MAIAAIPIAFSSVEWLAEGMPTTDQPKHSLDDALSGLREAAHINLERTSEILRRLEHFEARLASGDRISAIVTTEPTPRVVELLSQNMAALETSGANFRAAQARSLHDDGMTMGAIAELFGVTRQRISALLR